MKSFMVIVAIFAVYTIYASLPMMEKMKKIQDDRLAQIELAIK